MKRRLIGFSTISIIVVCSLTATPALSATRPPGRDFSRLTGIKPTVLPISISAQLPLLPAVLNQKESDQFILDSGGLNSITPEVAQHLGLKVEWGFAGIGMGDKPLRIGRTEIASIQIGDITLRNQIFSVVAFPYAATKSGIAGTLGYELLNAFAIKIDYYHKTVTLTDGRAFRYTGHGIAVPIFFRGTLPIVKGEIAGVAATFQIDTGSGTSLSLFAPFVKLNALTERLGAHIQGFAGEGLGGSESAYFARTSTFSMSGIQIDHVVTELLEDNHGIGAEDEDAGTVGTGILKQFIVTFDYSHHMLYLEKSANFGIPDVFNRSGLAIQIKPQGVLVASVFENSPAKEAGIFAGDTITAINGWTAEQITAERLFDILLGKPGNAVCLSISHSGVKRDVYIRLRDIL